MTKTYQQEVQHLTPFIKGLYIAMRNKGLEPKECIELINTTAKVCYADELTSNLKN